MARKHSFSNRKEAEAERDRWKQELPAVNPAYTPSGTLPARAKGFMAAGAILGIPVGLIAGTITAVVGLLLAAFCAWVFMAVQESFKIYWCGPIVFLVIVAVLTYFATYIAIGMGAGETVVRMGKLGKNRNVAFASLLSVASSLLAALAFWRLVGAPSADPAPQSARVEDESSFLWLFTTFLHNAGSTVFSSNTFGWVCIIAGLIIATASALIFASSRVAETKFCESCELYMDQWKLKPISFDSAKDMVKRFETGDIREAANVLNGDHEEEGMPALFACSNCGLGYLDVKMNFSAQWMRRADMSGAENTEEMTDSWLVASRALNRKEVDVFKNFIKKD